MGEKRDAYVKKLKEKLDQWNVEIDKLQTKADMAKAGARMRYRKEVEKLRKKSGELGGKLGVLRQTGKTAWQDLRAGLEVARKSLGESVKTAKSRFKPPKENP